MQLLPFITNIAPSTVFFPNASIQRRLTDEYAITGTGLTFTHYSRAWQMTNLSTATLSEKERYFLPATWMVFTINNTNSVAEDFYFGLPVPVTQRTFAKTVLGWGTRLRGVMFQTPAHIHK